MTKYHSNRLLWILLLTWQFSRTVLAAEHCVVLQYHHFSDSTPRITSVTPAEFDAHIQYLAENNFNVLAIQDVIHRINTGQPLPPRCVSLTVDDAYDSIYEVAFPRLREKGWPLTVFLNTETAEQGVKGYLSWDRMRELAAQGVRFENHSHSHAHLNRRLAGETEEQWRLRVRDDISTAQRLIEEKLDQTATLFAYPYGEYDPALQAIVSSLGLTAFGQQSGPLWHGSDRQALPRFPMAAGYAAMSGFRTKVNTRPLPVISASPRNPLLPLDEWQPKLSVQLAAGDYQPDQLRCYISGQAPGQLEWQDKAARRFTVTATEPLAVGRNRYNCTAPSNSGRYYYWYSHNWFRRHADGRWYSEY